MHCWASIVSAIYANLLLHKRTCGLSTLHLRAWVFVLIYCITRAMWQYHTDELNTLKSCPVAPSGWWVCTRGVTASQIFKFWATKRRICTINMSVKFTAAAHNVMGLNLFPTRKYPEHWRINQESDSRAHIANSIIAFFTVYPRWATGVTHLVCC